MGRGVEYKILGILIFVEGEDKKSPKLPLRNLSTALSGIEISDCYSFVCDKYEIKLTSYARGK